MRPRAALARADGFEALPAGGLHPIVVRDALVRAGQGQTLLPHAGSPTYLAIPAGTLTSVRTFCPYLACPGQGVAPLTSAFCLVRGAFVEPPIGIEPMTFSLRVQRSASTSVRWTNSAAGHEDALSLAVHTIHRVVSSSVSNRLRARPVGLRCNHAREKQIDPGCRSRAPSKSRFSRSGRV